MVAVPPRQPRAERLLLLALLVGATTSCLPLRYYTQLGVGEEELGRGGVSIAEVVEGKRLDARTRGLLAHIAEMKAFGERHGLVRTHSYERFVRLPGRTAVAWSVRATEPLSFRDRPRTFEHWYDREEARAYAASLARDGWDVDVRAVEGYSTRARREDPVVSTMLEPGPSALGELADIVFHETFHATFYVPGQRTLSESLARFFGDELALAYLKETFGDDAAETRAFVVARVRHDRWSERMRRARGELAVLYASSRPVAEMLAEKARVLAALSAEVRSREPITNASLADHATYDGGTDELRELLAVCGGSFARMLARLEPLRAMAIAPPANAVGKLLRPLIDGGC